MARIPRSGASSFAGWARALGSAVLALLLLGTSLTTAAGLLLTPSVGLEPREGPPGSKATVVVSGFENCPIQGKDYASPSEVRVTWDRSDVLATVPLSNGYATVSFVVPVAASLERHSVVVECVADPALRESAPFLVTPPEVPTTVVPDLLGSSVEEAATRLSDAGLGVGEVVGEGDVVVRQKPGPGEVVTVDSTVTAWLGEAPTRLVDVPDVVGLSVSEARAVLAEAGLSAGAVSGQGEVVKEQVPSAGARVPPESAVDLALRPVVPDLVPTPDLVGRRLSAVPTILGRAGLQLGTVTGDGTRVRSQTPPAGERVPSGSSVNVSVEAAVRPEPLTRVPDVVGMTEREAREALADRGLSMVAMSAENGRIRAQHPEPGAMVPVGSAVTVTASPAAPWRLVALVALALVALLGLTLVAIRLLRPKPPPPPPPELDVEWVRAHVRAVPAPGAGPDVRASQAPGEPPGPRHVVRVEPHQGERQHQLEEVHR